MPANNIWTKNLTSIDPGVFRSINGNADEMIAVGRCMKAGFPCSRADVTNGRYDAIVDIGKGKLLRIQVKGTSSKSVNFTGGSRSGKQIDKNAPRRTYKYTSKDCDVILAVDGRNGDCYIIPISDVKKLGNSKSLNLLGKYKENWKELKKMVGK